MGGGVDPLPGGVREGKNSDIVALNESHNFWCKQHPPWERWIARCLNSSITGEIREFTKTLRGEPLIAAVADHF